MIQIPTNRVLSEKRSGKQVISVHIKGGCPNGKSKTDRHSGQVPAGN